MGKVHVGEVLVPCSVNFIFSYFCQNDLMLDILCLFYTQSNLMSCVVCYVLSVSNNGNDISSNHRHHHRHTSKEKYTFYDCVCIMLP